MCRRVREANGTTERRSRSILGPMTFGISTARTQHDIVAPGKGRVWCPRGHMFYDRS
jgi:hypothetical protein